MVLKLYGIITSPAVRAVLLCVKALDLKIEWINVNIYEKEHLEPEYLKLNPQHTVPVLDDDGFILVDSHAIMTYLVTKYGKDDSLYPQEIQQRAIVNQRLHFDSSILFIRGFVIARGIIFEGLRPVPQNLLLALEEAFSIVEKFLENKNYIAGTTLTVADFSIVASLTTWSAFVPITEVRFPNIFSWIRRIQTLPYYQEANQTGLDKVMIIIKDKL